ncbi:hypothetical protein [Lachnobacterium bovis]|uniref:DNA-binding ferritin-like protein (Dps family) n=1 Tax=Lachnobacterium bovis TaxID=140626 RepID=A0A1H9QWK4_9FIRM|nr:hypothetical protein [Lachnobacterium bovis]SER64991.1 hypothetical protein SAMN02910429_00670 [Lachnobacterium bovis]
MNRKTKILNKQNNELDKLITDENQEVFTDIICYLRNADISDYNTEVVRNDISNMILDAQKRGDSIEQVIGGDYKEFCDNIIATFPKKTLSEKIFGIIDLLCICLSSLMVIFLFISKNTIDIIRNLATNQAVDWTYTVKLGTVLSFAFIILFSVFLVRMILNNVFEEKEKKVSLAVICLIGVTIVLAIVCLFIEMPLFNINIGILLAIIISLFAAHLIIDRVV